MSFDAWIVAFGLSRLLQELQIVESNASYLVLVAVGAIDIWLLYRFFSGAQQENTGAYRAHLGGIPSGPVITAGLRCFGRPRRLSPT